jgi:hypothetical protein
MPNYLIVLAVAGAMSVPAGAQTMPTNQTTPNSTNQAQQTNPPMVKKLVCEDNDDPFTNIHRVCHTVMVPAKPTTSDNTGQRAPAPPHSGN